MTSQETQRSPSSSSNKSYATIQTQSDISSECSSTIESNHNHLSGGRLGEAARIKQLNSQNITGAKNYRPLVGGFAAAAYEASKGDHYLKEEGGAIDNNTS
mmetsp:Transcript_22919/g.27113  ORF Transcript_22919/g.27113 Transcript_22919/m.27113 type:complete len:101 (-) Transcript_22919:763-1065(-)